jgi:hypothetical protein
LFPVLLGLVFSLGVLGYGLPVSAQEAKIQRLGGQRFLTETLLTYPTAGLDGFSLAGPSNLRGEIIITTAETDSVEIRVVKILKAGSMELARLFAGEIATILKEKEDQLVLHIRTKPGAPWEGTDWTARCDITITLPRQWDIAIKAHHFDYDLKGPFRSVKINTDFGRVKLSNVTDKTVVKGEHTAIELTDLRGIVRAETSYAKLSARRITTSPEEPAYFANEFGEMTIRELVGAVVVEMNYTPTTLTDAVLVGATSRLLGRDARIKAEIVEFSDAKLEVQNHNADVVLKVPADLSARLNFSTGRRGTIRTRGIEVQTHADLLGRGRLEGTCGRGSGIIDVEVTGQGSITMRGG